MEGIMDKILNEKSIACLMKNGIKSGRGNYNVVRNVYGGFTLFKGENKVYSNDQKLVYNDITKKYVGKNVFQKMPIL